jgi:hypothetical protein
MALHIFEQFMSATNLLLHNERDNVHDLQDLGMFDGVIDFQPVLAPGKNTRGFRRLNLSPPTSPGWGTAVVA